MDRKKQSSKEKKLKRKEVLLLSNLAPCWFLWTVIEHLSLWWNRLGPVWCNPAPLFWRVCDDRHAALLSSFLLYCWVVNNHSDAGSRNLVEIQTLFYRGIRSRDSRLKTSSEFWCSSDGFQLLTSCPQWPFCAFAGLGLRMGVTIPHIILWNWKPGFMWLCYYQELAKKQSIDEFVRVANAKAAPIEEFPSFLKYERNGRWAAYSGCFWRSKLSTDTSMVFSAFLMPFLFCCSFFKKLSSISW